MNRIKTLFLLHIMLMIYSDVYKRQALIKINSLGDVIKVFGATGKVCVALLTILSGYGLMESYKKVKNYTSKSNLKFVISHLVQLLSLIHI